MDFLNNITGSQEEFLNISEKLFNEYAIATSDSLYRIIEIEFYWNSPEHIDNSTYKRTYADPKSGEWFFHYSGVDISLRNENGYGGILIRGIYDLLDKNKKTALYSGPMVCSMKLFSGTNAFTGCIPTRIIPYKFMSTEIIPTERIGLGKNAIENNANKLQYRFFIQHVNV